MTARLTDAGLLPRIIAGTLRLYSLADEPLSGHERAARLAAKGWLRVVRVITRGPAHGTYYAITDAGRARLKSHDWFGRWEAPIPRIKKAHDVRKLHCCLYCDKLGDALLKLPREGASAWAHGYCLIKNAGWTAYAELPEVERDKLTLNDMLGLGVTSLTELETMMAKRGTR